MGIESTAVRQPRTQGLFGNEVGPCDCAARAIPVKGIFNILSIHPYLCKNVTENNDNAVFIKGIPSAFKLVHTHIRANN